MTDIRSLEQTLLDNLLQNKARIKFVARFLLALVSLRQSGVGTSSVMGDCRPMNESPRGACCRGAVVDHSRLAPKLTS